MLVFWILFSIIVPIGLLYLGTFLYIKLIEAWPAFVCWGLALIALVVGIFFSVSIHNEKDTQEPVSIIETSYNYCPYCGKEIKQ
jgi:uncharacterized membrane protein